MIGDLRGEVTIFDRRQIAEILFARFVHGIQSVIKFVFLNVHAFLTRLLELIEDMLRLVDLGSVLPPVSPSLPVWSPSPRENLRDVFKSLRSLA